MPKNAHTTAQLHLSHTLVNTFLKFSKPGFSNTWTVNFQMFKLVLEKSEELEIKLSISTGSLKKQDSSRKKHLFLLYGLYQTLCGSNKPWKILKDMGIPDHLTCLLRNLYAGQEATVRTGHGPTDWFKIGKGVRQGCLLSPCLFDLYAEYIIRSAGLDEAQAGIKVAGRDINNVIYADDTTLWHEVKKN